MMSSRRTALPVVSHTRIDWLATSGSIPYPRFCPPPPPRRRGDPVLPGDTLAIAFSGAEDVALIQYASLTGRPFRVFSLDTGRLNPETYQLFDDVEKHFGIKIEFTFPDEDAVVELVNEKGMFSFYEDGHKARSIR